MQHPEWVVTSRTVYLARSRAPRRSAAGREVIPGAVTLQFVERVKDEYGDGSTVYQSRVLGEFPEESESSLVLHRWVREAQANFASGVHEELSRKRSWVVAVDPARMGPDKTALGLR